MPRPIVFLILALPLVGAYAMYAIGIVVTYQSSRVLNLAHGAMATVPAFFMYVMVTNWGLPLGVALPAGILSGAGLGVLIERVFVRRLRRIGPTAQTVGTVAAYGLLVSLAAKIWGAAGLKAPTVFPEGHLSVGASQLRYGQIGLFVVALISAGLLHLLLHKTWFGLAMRGAAENRRAASLMGLNPDRTASAAWALAGSLAALAGILLAAVTSLHPYSLSLSVLPAFVAALIGGLASLPAALVGSAIVGVVIGFVPVLGDLPVLRLVLGQLGGAELMLAVTAMVVMAVRGKSLVGGDAAGEAPPAPVRARSGKRRPVLGFVVAVALLGWVFIPNVPFSILGDANQALIYLVVAASLVLLTGWVGQISLAQAAFVGVGAYATTFVARNLDIPFPFTIPVGALVAAAAATALGAVALRVRGLYLAVATLIFGWMADSYLFSAPWLTGAGGSISVKVKPIGVKDGFPYFDFAERRTFYFVALAGAALALFALANLRRSKTGRAFFAVRGSETAAASLGIDVTRYKLVAFALSGAIAGVAGNLIVTGSQAIVPAQFAFTVSLFFLSVAVVGGIQSLGGAVSSAMLFAALNEVFFRVDALRGWLDVVSAGLLAAVLLFYPGGLSALAGIAVGAGRAARRLGERMLSTPAGARFRDSGWPGRARALLRGAGRELRGDVRGMGSEVRGIGRLAAWPLRKLHVIPNGNGRAHARRTTDAGTGADALARLSGTHAAYEIEPVRDDRPVVLEAEGVTIRFGGLTAVSNASLAVRRGEIVGLIGPNGAGKTTCFNAIAGFTKPATGRVFLNREDVTDLAVNERAARGIGRTFQLIQLFPQLSVLENLLVATHVRNRTGLLSHLTVGAATIEAERAALERVMKVVDLLGLHDIVERPVAGLPFGTLRMVEVARALVTGAPLVMLDEPASGLDNAETEKLSELLLFVREKLGVSLLLIEHDVHMVMSMCDYVYVLDRGELIAEGTPAVVQEDPAVMAAYLGRAADEPAPIPEPVTAR